MSNGKILFRCGQWVVTTYGLEVADNFVKQGRGYPYEIEAARLTATTERDSVAGPMYDWPVHLAEKGWVVREDFLTAFPLALSLHVGKLRERLDPAILARTIAYARAHWVFEPSPPLSPPGNEQKASDSGKFFMSVTDILKSGD